LTVAIDGPVAAGKTTVGGLVARRLGAIAFDTGMLYRAVAHEVVRRGADPNDRDAVAAIAKAIDVKLRPPSIDDGRLADVLVDGRDVTGALRSPEIDRALPPVAANPAVREALLAPQRRIATSGRVVTIGRDIGTVVVPDAEFKFYLDAPADIRAQRRYAEMKERGEAVGEDDVRRDLQARDARDMSRAEAPLRQAADAVYLDSTNLSANEVADAIIEHMRSRRAENAGMCIDD
jgi:cytidylate kinase